MAYQPISLGTSANDNTGDSPRVAGDKINDNFVELYAADAALGTMSAQNASSVSITGGSITGITDLAVADGGTGSSTAAGARTNLGVVIGTDVQAYNANLAAIAGLTSAADRGILFTGSGAASVYTLTGAGRNLLDDASTSDQRTTLGLAIGTDVQAYDAELAAIAGLTSAADRLPYFTGSGTASLATFSSAGRALVDDADASAQRTTLGLGSLAIVTPTGTPNGAKFLRDDNAWTAIPGGGDLLAANNLSDVASASTSRTNLGLGTIATQAANNVSITGGSVTGITDIAIADGGTGQSTANAAFNALAPSQATHSGKYLTTNGADTSWATVSGSGDVVGPASSVDSEIALFDSTTGKLLKRASGSGIAKVTSGVLSTVTAPSGAIVGTTDAQNLSGKTFTDITTFSATPSIALGVAGSALGGATFYNATSGSIVLQAASGALGSSAVSIPAGTYTLIGTNLSQIMSQKSFQDLTAFTAANPSISVGNAGASQGGIQFFNATSGSISVVAPSGALGTRTLTLPIASDTLVGRDTTDTFTNKTLTNPTITNYVETLYAPSAGSSFTVALTDGTCQKLTTNANCTITLPSSVAGKTYTIIVAYGGTHTITWAGGSTIKWAGGTAPTATSVNAKFDIYVFTCDGTNTYGADGGRNY